MPEERMTGPCAVCGRYSYLEAHHIVKGRGKRRECETKESVVHLCADCHRGTYGVHGRDGHALDMYLRRQLQATYFSHGRSETEVRRLMGGKLMLGEDGEIAGLNAGNADASGHA